MPKYEVSESIYQFRTITDESCEARSLKINIAENTEIGLTFISGGVFSMGSGENEPPSRSNERPRHEVTVKDFWLGTTPITNRQWRLIMDESIVGNPADEEAPVVDVWLEKAHEFCRKLSEYCELEFRLPTESEWEYACRAGSSTDFAFGEKINNEIVNHDDKQGPRPVMTGEVANSFGLYDMHGSVWEWCSDIWHPTYDDAPNDGSSWDEDGDASYRVQRGGAWNSTSRSCRSACRVGDIARNSEGIVGIRIALDV